ncbi:hypothetical protein LAJ19_15840 (plasmid) [Deinococcus taeanensis]|uniref:transposase-like zinc-binding domain-containing protein n=1 Tax=Deinococcus taeanensis TaxID=2737050 RepID=UPI001CDC0DEF|nr:hypothetical protein LAJ19_15840 [Deinococcus taeanensis]
MNGIECPQCDAVRIVKNGHTQRGRQRHLCRACGFPKFRIEPPGTRRAPVGRGRTGCSQNRPQ